MSTQSNLWSNYQWPEWVPSKIRQEIEKFWFPEWGRGPQQWQESAEYYNAPSLGDIALLSTLTANKHQGALGRYVHAWGNIGRIIHEDGTYSCVSLHKPIEPIEVVKKGKT